MNLSKAIKAVVEQLNAPATVEELPSLAVSCGKLISASPTGGAFLIAHTVLLALYARLDGEPLSAASVGWLRAITAALAKLVSAPSDPSALTTIAVSWTELTNPPAIH